MPAVITTGEIAEWACTSGTTLEAVAGVVVCRNTFVAMPLLALVDVLLSVAADSSPGDAAVELAPVPVPALATVDVAGVPAATVELAEGVSAAVAVVVGAADSTASGTVDDTATLRSRVLATTAF